jgi:hypothetical protein
VAVLSKPVLPATLKLAMGLGDMEEVDAIVVPDESFNTGDLKLSPLVVMELFVQLKPT